MKASPFEGEIKIRLFITSILFLLGRGSSQTVNCQLSTVNCSNRPFPLLSIFLSPNPATFELTLPPTSTAFIRINSRKIIHPRLPLARNADRLKPPKPTQNWKHPQSSLLLPVNIWYYYFIARIVPTSN
ncbi:MULTISPECIES: hypothetical protein [unclassified Microcoleus]|uniref:hypothetical protein n=1 Tax=unclassified Microcoleus TaxID=2642155 RepID=UPI0025E453C0|nr:MULTISPECIES: hypothetical protein [unclassified Microcoleus]